MESRINIFPLLSRLHMNQAELAKELETSPANVNKWVKKEGVPSYELCCKLLELGMTIEELFGISYPNEPLSDCDFEEKVISVIMKKLAK